jgi:methyl-accepting chemotaxis protein
MDFGRLRPWGTSLKDVLEVLPTCVLLVDPMSLEVISANAASRAVLKELSALLPEGEYGETMTGLHIGFLLEGPAVGARLSDPEFLPYRAIVPLGRDLLAVQIAGVCTRSGRLDCLAVSWERATRREHMRLMVEKMPGAVLMADAETLEITLANRVARETLQSLQKHIKAPVGDLLGKCIDQFHDAPEHQRVMLADPEQMPIHSVITIGPAVLSIDVCAIRDERGHYLGPMLSMTDVTERYELHEQLRKVTTLVAQSAVELKETAEILSRNADESSREAEQAATASQQASANASSVAAAAGDLGRRTGAILDEVGSVLQVSREAVEEAEGAKQTMVDLTVAAVKIDKVLEFTKELATQTNLLSVNAAIEAARAGGRAGRAFQIVATEVKRLAKVTAEATDQITQLVSSIQRSTAQARERSEGVATTMTELDKAFSEMSGAVEKQLLTTSDIVASSESAARGAAGVSETVARVQHSSKETGTAAEDLRKASTEMAHYADSLLAAIETVL